MIRHKIETALNEAFPGAELLIKDVRGNGSHWEVEIASDAFEGLSKIKRHQAVYRPLKHLLASEEIHAINIVAKTMAEIME